MVKQGQESGGRGHKFYEEYEKRETVNANGDAKGLRVEFVLREWWTTCLVRYSLTVRVDRNGRKDGGEGREIANPGQNTGLDKNTGCQI